MATSSDRDELLDALTSARESWLGYRANGEHEQAETCLMFIDSLLDDFLLAVRGA